MIIYNLYFLAQIQLYLKCLQVCSFPIVPADIHLINANNGKTETMIEIYLKLTKETPKRLGVLPLLALKKWMPAGVPFNSVN